MYTPTQIIEFLHQQQLETRCYFDTEAQRDTFLRLVSQESIVTRTNRYSSLPSGATGHLIYITYNSVDDSFVLRDTGFTSDGTGGVTWAGERNWGIVWRWRAENEYAITYPYGSPEGVILGQRLPLIRTTS